MAPRASGRAARVKDAIAAKAARGQVLGRTPYGYRAGLDGLLEPLPSEARIVQDIFHLYAGTDSPGERPGLRRIAAGLNKAGVSTRNGGTWTPSGLAGILRNPAYTGEYRRGDIRIAGNHAAIVDRITFERAQEALSLRRPARRARTRGAYALAGLVECAGCGRVMHGLLRDRRWTRKGGAETRRAYRYYECPSRPLGRDRHASWRAEKLEEAVRERLLSLAARDGLDATMSSDPGLARQALRALVETVIAGADAVEVRLRVESD